MVRRKRSKAGGASAPQPQQGLPPVEEALKKLTKTWWDALGPRELDAAFDRTLEFIDTYKEPEVLDMLAAEDCIQHVAWPEFRDTLAPHRRRAAVERRYDSTLLMCMLIPAGARVLGPSVWDFYLNGPETTRATHEWTLGEFLRAVQEELFAPGVPMSIDGVRMLETLFSYVDLLVAVVNCSKPFIDCGLLRALPAPARNALIAKDESYASAWADVEGRERPKPDPSNVIVTIVAQMADLSLHATVKCMDPAQLTLYAAILELMTLLLGRFATRRFVEPLVVVSGAGAVVEAFAVRSLTLGKETLPQLQGFLDELHEPVDCVTGKEICFEERQRRHAADVVRLQRECAKFAAPSLETIAYAAVDQIGAPRTFGPMVERAVRAGKLSVLLKAAKLDLLNAWAAENDPHFSLMWSTIVAIHYEAPRPPLVRQGPLPDADAVFSDPMVFEALQEHFLTLHDWARRRAELAELETTEELMQQLAETLLRLDVRADGAAGGWAHDAVFLGKSLAPVAGSEAGKFQADVKIDLAPFPELARAEWRAVKPQDQFCVVVLAGRGPKASRSKRPRALATVDAALKNRSALRDFYAIRAVHLAHLLAVVDDSTQSRTLRLKIDGSVPDKSLLTILVRLRPRVTRAVARSADIEMHLDPANHERFQLPEWCRAAILGHAHPSCASMGAFLPQTLYLGDAIFDAANSETRFDERIAAPAGEADTGLWAADVVEDETSYLGQCAPRQLKESDLGDRAPMRRYNTLHFARSQLNAIVAGCGRGLAVIDGCNGSGKTVITAQIVANLYHAPGDFAPRWPTALIASTEAYLGRVLARIFTLGVRPWHVARPGTDMQLQAAVKERQRLLGLVAQIAAHLGVSETAAESAAAACEFFRSTVQPRWAAFEREIPSGVSAPNIWATYPFPQLDDAEAGQRGSAARARKSVKRLYRSIAAVFADLETLKILEVLQDPQDQTKALLQRAAKVFVGRSAAEILAGDGAQQFSSIIVLGAAQLRVVDVLPVIASAAVERICLLGTEQMIGPDVPLLRLWNAGARDSLFKHLVRLRLRVVPIAWNRRCEAGPLWNVYATTAMDLFDDEIELDGFDEEMVPPANAGFACVAQAVQVPGLGETRVAPGRVIRGVEADYVVSVFQYMRLIGYDADRIAIVCMTDAQVDLVRDEIARRCGRDPRYGWPAAIVTPYQTGGVECEIVLVSLVYTIAIPEALADPRIMMSTVSRASHGAYFFGELALFPNKLTLTLDHMGPTDALYLRGGELADGSVRRHAKNTGLVQKSNGSWEVEKGSNMSLVYKIESAEQMRAHVAKVAVERAAARVAELAV